MNDDVRQIRKLFGSKQKKPYEFKAVLGRSDGTVKATDETVYVTLLNGDVLEVFNERVPLVAFRKVKIGYDEKYPSLLQVLAFDDIYDSHPLPHLPNHKDSHVWYAHDPVEVFAQQFMQLLPRAVGGMTVRVFGGEYSCNDVFGILPNTDIDLSAEIPTSGAEWVNAEVDDAGAITFNHGAVNKGSREMLEPSDIPLPASDKKMLFSAKMYVGMTALIQTRTDTDIYDPRFTGATNGVPGASSPELFLEPGPPTIADDYTQGHVDGDIWIDQTNDDAYILLDAGSVTCIECLEGTAVWYQINGSGGGVESVTGDGVDNTDPLNPVIVDELNTYADLDEGDEELENPVFTGGTTGWTLGDAGWVWSDVDGETGKVCHTPGYMNSLEQSGSLLVNVWYVVEVDVQSMTAGSLRVQLDDGVYLDVLENGTYSFGGLWVPDASVKVKLLPSTDFDGCVHFVNVNRARYAQLPPFDDKYYLLNWEGAVAADASLVEFTPAEPTDWDVEPNLVSEGLDELAQRVEDLENDAPAVDLEVALAFLQLASSKGDIYDPGTDIAKVDSILLYNGNTTDEAVKLYLHNGSTEFEIFSETLIANETTHLPFLDSLFVNASSKITGNTTTAAKVTFLASGSIQTAGDNLALLYLPSTKGDIYDPGTDAGKVMLIFLHNLNTTDEIVTLYLHNGTNEYAILKVTIPAGKSVWQSMGEMGLPVNASSKITGVTTTASKVTCIVCGTERTP